VDLPVAIETSPKNVGQLVEAVLDDEDKSTGPVSRLHGDRCSQTFVNMMVVADRAPGFRRESNGGTLWVRLGCRWIRGLAS